MKNKIQIFLLMLLSFCGRTLAVFPKFTDSTRIVQIQLVVIDTEILNGGSIEFVMYNAGINSKYSMDIANYTFKVRQTMTEISLPVSKELTYGRINLTYDAQKNSIGKEPFSPSKNLFLFRAGDSIKIHTTRNDVRFEGRGSEKYTFSYSSNKDIELKRIQSFTERTLERERRYPELIAKVKYNQDSIFKVKLKRLDTLRSLIGEDAYNLMKADIWGKFNYDLLAKLFKKISLEKLDNDFRTLLTMEFKNYSENFPKNYLSENTLSASYHFADYLFAKEKFLELIGNKGGEGKISPFRFLHRSIWKMYDGQIRDKLLLLNFYFSRIEQSELLTAANATVESMLEGKYKKALVKLTDSRQGEAYNFALKDRFGKVHKMEDYKGKLVIMDFWYTGCGGCKNMAKALKPIVAEYSSNPEVVFMTISADGEKLKDVWLKSLKEESYSCEGEVNLLASDGYTSEIIKRYNIIRYPTLVIVSKDGKVLTSYPPNPILVPMDFKRFIDSNL